MLHAGFCQQSWILSTVVFAHISVTCHTQGNLTYLQVATLPALGPAQDWPSSKPSLPADGQEMKTRVPVSVNLPQIAARESSSRAPVPGSKPQRSAPASRSGQKVTNAQSSRPKQATENTPTAASGYVPAYMKSTASNKAKDAREQHAKIAAARSALTEKKWNRA